MIVDSSAVVALLSGQGEHARFVARSVRFRQLAAPAHMYAEVTNGLRRLTERGHLSREGASLAHSDLLGLRVVVYPYTPLAGRIWELRQNLSSYDAWYVALAESLDEPLLTLDLRLARAPGLTCEFLTPPDFD